MEEVLWSESSHCVEENGNFLYCPLTNKLSS